MSNSHVSLAHRGLYCATTIEIPKVQFVRGSRPWNTMRVCIAAVKVHRLLPKFEAGASSCDGSRAAQLPPGVGDRRGGMMNVHEPDSVGNRVCEWCFLPEGKLAAGDVMLAQKIALETFESEALAVANRGRLFWHGRYLKPAARSIT